MWEVLETTRYYAVIKFLKEKKIIFFSVNQNQKVYQVYVCSNSRRLEHTSTHWI